MIWMRVKLYKGFPGGLVVKHSSPVAGDESFIPGFNSWLGTVPWRRKHQPTPVFLPGKSHGQRSLVGYCPWGCKASDMTEQLSTHTISSTFSFSMKLYPLWTFTFLFHLQDSVFSLSYWVVSEYCFCCSKIIFYIEFTGLIINTKLWNTFLLFI